MHIDVSGKGPRVVFVHGSVGNGAVTWSAVRPLADRFALVVLDRPGYPPNPPLERIDFDTQAGEIAEVLAPGDHLVGHSYGGVIALLAAARRPHAVRSLTAIEPPAFLVARGIPVVDELVARLRAFLAAGPHDPESYLRGFLPAVGSDFDVPSPLPPLLEQGARAAIAERPPSEAEIPLAELAAAPFPKLVISGGHHPAFEAVCDALQSGLDAERAVVPGAGHSIPRAPGFAETLAGFLARA